MNAERKHALLSPSAAHRWLHCPPSARLCENAPDSASVYAAEGSCAHELAEYKLLKFMGVNAKSPVENLDYYSQEMEDFTDDYVNFCLGEYQRLLENGGKPHMVIEQSVDFCEYVPNGSGSADCLIVSEGEMVVIDLKYGSGVEVEAENNPQLRLYALGCLLAFDMIFDIKTVKMCIVQPRRDNISAETLTAQELYDWAEEAIKPAAALAWDGNGEQCAGDWCRFCKIKVTCRARADANMELARYEFRDPKQLDDSEVAEILGEVDKLVSWAGDVKEYALCQALRGVRFNGWKLVEGRSNRKYVDEDAVAETVTAAGFDPYEHKLRGITAMSDLLGKKQFDKVLGGLVVKPAGKPVLVAESDKRQEINVNTAADDFSEPFADQ